MRIGLLIVCTSALVHLATIASGQEAPSPDFAGVGTKFLETHCTGCHSGDKPKGEIDLAKFTDTASLVKNRKAWDNIVRVVAGGQMPPKDEAQPAAAEVETFTSLVRSIFDYADLHAKPDPGRVTMRRLNKQEYRNTVRDLLGVDFDPTENFPSDDVGYGFDNIGDVLTLSPLLMERYLAAAEMIVNRVIVVNPPKPSARYLSGKYLQPNNAQTSQDRFRVLDPTNPDKVHSGPYTAAGEYLKFTADADLYFRATLYAEPKSDAPVMVALFISGTDLKEVSTDAEIEQLMGANLEAMKPMKILQTFEITARSPDQLQTLELPINHRGDIQRAGIAVVKPPAGKEPPKLLIESLWSEGPLETRPPSHLMLLSTTPGKSQPEQTQEVLHRFLRRAYRRPPTAEEVQRVTQIVDEAIAAGDKWETGIQRAMEATLCSPKFLFRVELDDRPIDGPTQPLDEFQLASRLSYFLWSTMPDDTLLDLAAQGQLTANLDAQVKRMLADPKANALVDNFALQWLQVKRLATFAPDAKLFPQFNEPLRAAMLKETELFFGSIMREDRSILELLNANYTFLNAPLAQLYGIADTNGNAVGQPATRPGGQAIPAEEFVRVDLTDHPARGGLLTQASILTVTSNPTRTSPVKRGRWVLEQILGNPPPPPPPNVPELPADENAVVTGSLRTRLEAHRANPSCANCHAKMDPLGFAFENFDAIGAFRTKDGNFDIDPSGVLPDGRAIADAKALKVILQERKDEVARCLAEKLLIYALGRGLEYYDRPTLESVLIATKNGEYKFSALVTAIVRSDAFTKRRGSDAAPQ